MVLLGRPLSALRFNVVADSLESASALLLIVERARAWANFSCATPLLLDSKLDVDILRADFVPGVRASRVKGAIVVVELSNFDFAATLP